MLFFVAIAIPTAILIYQAYSQLKWEAFFQHRVMAEELAKRIDDEITEFIEVENKRAFTEYTFLNIAGDSKVNFLQRSPIAEHPVKSTFPGVIGYFQIDHRGGFSSPLLPNPIPSTSSLQRDYGLGGKDLSLRIQTHNKIYSLLSDNHLVGLTSAVKPASAALENAAEQPADKLNTGKLNGEKLNGEKLNDKNNSRNDQHIVSSDQAYSQAEQEDLVQNQSGFDKLQSKNDLPLTPRQSLDSSSGFLGRVSDLKLEKRYRRKLAATEQESDQDAGKESKLESSVVQTKTAQAAAADEPSKRLLRKEQNILPIQAAQPGKPPQSTEIAGRSEAVMAEALADREVIEGLAEKPGRTPVSMFESEIDRLQLSMLNSGHFVLYRNVWRDGQRYTQGLLIEAKPFISTLIEKNYLQTSLAKTTELTTAYSGNVLAVLSGASADNYLSSTRALQGSLLLQRRLSAPLDDMELLFSISTLPTGPGAKVINWLAAVLLLILSGGLLLMYRLGLQQINLACQQQDFVSAISHEFKTPLTSIRMYGELLREGWASEDKKRSYYDFIYDESERLSRLINNVLQLGRMTRNDLQLELVPCPVSQLVDTVQSKIASQIAHADFELDFACDTDILEKSIEVDLDSFVQIMINLIDNAIKFSANSSTRKIDIGCRALSDGRIQFTVRDYGPGIEKHQMRKIFHLFYRSENELTRETVGTGIGLALVKHLVIAMNGQIDVLNRDPGVEFKIIFIPAGNQT